MISLVEVNLAENFTTIQVGQHVVDGGNNVSFPDDCFVKSAHVNTDSYFVWLLGLGNHNDW